MPKTWVRPYRRKYGTYVRGHSREQRVFGAFGPKGPPGYKGWIQICLMACFTPLIPIAFPILLILLIILLIEKISDFFESKKMESALKGSADNKKSLGFMVHKGQKMLVSLYLELKRALKNKQNRSHTLGSNGIFKKFIPQKNIKYEYSANINSRTFHHHNCKWAKQISPKNVVCFDNREEAVKIGMAPCKFCKP